MKKNSIRYFDNIIMPLICSRHSDILHEASMMIFGSVGLGNDDELSDVEAVIYLCVHPLSWLLDYRVEKILAGDSNVPWEELSFESLFTIQKNPIYYDP